MKRALLFAALAAALISGAGAVRAAGFTYHGNLQDAGKPATGKYDIELTLYSAQTGGSVIGGPLTIYAVPVRDGSFSTEADFGPLAKSFSQSYVGVKVRAAGSGNYAALDARASVTPEVNTSCPGSWSLDGNAGNLAGSYLGTADAQPLTLRVNGEDSLRITEVGLLNSYHCVNVIGGVYTNSITGMCGTIAGGGSIDSGDFSNKVTAGYGSILGGESNSAGSYASELGGHDNVASGGGSTVLGGFNNQAGGVTSLAAGQSAHVRNAAEAGVTTGDHGTFVWADSTGSGLSSTGANQFDILATGGVGINSAPLNADVELTIVANGSSVDYANVFMRQLSTPAGILFSSGQATAGNNNAQFFLDQYDGTNQTRRLTVGANGDFTVTASAFKPGGGSWTATSDRRIKQDVTPIQDALDTVMKLRPVNFRYTPEYRAMEGGLADKSYAGFIAQEYKDVFPEAVVSTDKHVPGTSKNDPTILALDPNPALITTVAAVQELAVENAALHRHVDGLEARLSKLEAGKGQ